MGRGLGFVWLILAFRGGASGKARMQPYVFPSSLEAASRQREEVSSAYMKVCAYWEKRERVSEEATGQKRMS